MDFVTIDDVPGGSAGAKLTSGEILHFARAAQSGTIESWLPGTVKDILAGGAEGIAIARQIVERAENGKAGAQLRQSAALLPSDTRLLSPIPNPRLLLAQGLAYKSHLEEMSGTPTPPHPTAFMKSPNSIAGPEEALVIPPQAPSMVDYEGELALVFGRTCYRVDEAEAMSYVAGITAANDISARDWTPEVFAATEAWDGRLTWEVNLMGKQLPGFTPLGPVLRTLDSIDNMTDLILTTRVNGQTVQHDAIGGMIFSIQKVIAYFSKWYRFEPGDILLTGTPAGVGIGRDPQLFLKPGDVVEVELEGCGVLRTPIIESSDSA